LHSFNLLPHQFLALPREERAFLIASIKTKKEDEDKKMKEAERKNKGKGKRR